MGFTKTSEGRVFFRNADNDDTPRSASSAAPQEPVLPADNTQMQMLMLLKSLNTKIKNTKEDRATIKKELAEYKKTIKALEDKTTEQQENYIDLEQKLSRKQVETNKKTSRVETEIKKTLEQLEEARALVKELESKTESYDKSLETIKETVGKRNKIDETIVERQKTIEAAQKAHDEKMVNNVAAYVALTKRVSETETRQEALDNKIEDTTAEYLKLDRKIDKALEDRNRILRKVERIEQAVLETRDALNAKAMVLLTDGGMVGGVSMPNIMDQTLQTDPVLLNRRLQEEALMPVWRRPIRIQGVSLVLMMIIVLLLGWILSEATRPAQQTTAINPYSTNIAPPPPVISLENNKESDAAPYIEKQNTFETAQNNLPPTTSDDNIYDDYTPPVFNEPKSATSAIPVIDPEIDINNDAQMLSTFETDPNKLAETLNALEPTSLTAQDKVPPPAPQQSAEITDPIKPTVSNVKNNVAYKTELRKKIQPDPTLTDTAKKIEAQAFDGVPEAQHDMGAIYVAGHGQIKQDLNRAVLWFTEAAQNGIANAKYNLGVLYHQGMGVKKDIPHAMELYREAADLGHPEAQYNLGIAYIEGIGVDYDPARAARYFERAANQKITEAAYNLGLIYENGLLGETHPDEALAWYKTAADNGSPEAQSALEQLAKSLGINIEEVNRIVENVSKNTLTSQNSSASDYDDSQRKLLANIQAELMRRGLYPGPVDGMNGPMTTNAIATFQRAADLDASGQPSEELLRYLKASGG